MGVNTATSTDPGVTWPGLCGGDTAVIEVSELTV